ncbi:MAG: energy transducer TonB [Bryobacteraceae bacterium]
MFEQAVLTNPAKRVWSTCAGMTAQALLVLAACLAPVVSPDVLPRARMLVSLMAPGPPVRQAPVEVPRQPDRVVSFRPYQPTDGRLLLPLNPPAHAHHIDDPPADVSSIPGGNALTGEREGSNSLLTQILNSRPAVQIRLQERPAAAVPPTPAAPIRLRGGDVRLAHPIYRVEPRYPQMAIIARISGAVELEGIIGTDGRIRDLHALSGNPLLVPAALEAVRQWIYTPTLLDGKPVEVIGPITVIFRLTQ